MVECFLAKEDVAGSTPVSRSKNALTLLPYADRPTLLRALRCKCTKRGSLQYTGRGTQVVRERSAKPLCAGSIPARASTFPADTL